MIGEVLAIVGGSRMEAPAAAKPTRADLKTGAAGDATVKPEEVVPGAAGSEAVKPQGAPPAAAPAKTGEKTGEKSGETTADGAMNATGAVKPVAESGTPVIALPERGGKLGAPGSSQ